jgi:hypothetical protein
MRALRAMRFLQFDGLRSSSHMMGMKAIDGDVLVNESSDRMGVALLIQPTRRLRLTSHFRSA